MPIPLPNLDDRRWQDLVEEGRALIPVYSPEWTDHNASDPGITLLELFAWLSEMDIYRANRVADRHKRKFLALAGVEPLPPKSARVVVGLDVKSGTTLHLNSGSEFEGDDSGGIETAFRTLEEVTAIDARIQAVQVFDGTRFVDWTARWKRGQALMLLGDAAEPGAAFYLGFDKALDASHPA